jgi:pimeloyl-ACP methyl ester carboxylesterase
MLPGCRKNDTLRLALEGLIMCVRKYGKPPFNVAILHGGPGAPGYMAPVARRLASGAGVLEPLQSKDSLEGQIEELHDQLTAHANLPVTLIGSSWGAVLALFVAARYNSLVRKLVLIGSALFDADSSSQIESRRLARLSDKQRQRLKTIESELNGTPEGRSNDLFEEWGDILSSADVYDPLEGEFEDIEVQHQVFKKVWGDFVALRDRPNYLKTEFSAIDIPVIIIHGDYDPHPIEGIRPFLESCLNDVRFQILPKCGHYPWRERQARDKFFEILQSEIR